MQRAVVIRACGNPELAKGLVATMESPELKKLRAQVGIPFKQKLWGLYGLAVLLSHGNW